jgi:hypothetical protein
MEQDNVEQKQEKVVDVMFEEISNRLGSVTSEQSSDLLDAIKAGVTGAGRKSEPLSPEAVAIYLVSKLPTYELDYLYKKILGSYAKHNAKFHRPETDDSIIMSLIGPNNRNMKTVKQLKTIKKVVLPKMMTFALEGDMTSWGKVALILFPSGLKQKVEDSFEEHVEDICKVFRIDHALILNAVIDQKMVRSDKRMIMGFKQILIDFANRHVRPGLVPHLTGMLATWMGIGDNKDDDEEIIEALSESDKKFKENDGTQNDHKF